MSWDAYIDNVIAQSKDAAGAAHCSKACLVGLDTGGMWTTAGHPNALIPTAQESAQIASCFKSGKFDPFMCNGVLIGGVKYNFLREEDGKLVLAKKKDQGAVTLQKTKTAIIIAYCPEGSQQGNVNKGVGVLGDYLESLNM